MGGLNWLKFLQRISASILSFGIVCCHFFDPITFSIKQSKTKKEEGEKETETWTTHNDVRLLILNLKNSTLWV